MNVSNETAFVSNITGNWTNMTENGTDITGNGTNSTDLRNPTVHCGKEWKSALDVFNNMHPNPVVMLLCLVGCVTNVFNLMVFTQKCMKSPTITILTMLAVSDFFCVFRRVLEEIVLSQFAIIPKNTSTQTTKVILRFFASLFHFWSVFLTVEVAVWRYAMIRFPLRSRAWCTEQMARWTILISFFSSGFFAYLSRVLGEDVTKIKNTRERYGALVHFWTNSLVEKLFPCFILVFVSLQLRQSLIKAKEKRVHMTVKSKEKAQTDKETCSRTTKMLLFAVLLFIVTELPSGILSFVTAILETTDPGNSFYKECFQPIRVFLGMLEFVSSTANFFIYYSTGANFKQTFLKTMDRNLSKVIKMKRRVGGNFKFASQSMEHSTTGTGTGTGALAGNQTDSKLQPKLLTMINKSTDYQPVKTENEPNRDQDQDQTRGNSC